VSRLAAAGDHLNEGTGRGSANFAGATWMTLGMAGYVVNDALIKWATESIPLYQAIAMRGAAIILLLAVVIRLRGGRPTLSPIRHPLVALRVAIEAGTTVLYLTALTNAPLANLTAILQLVPVVVTFVAARVLHERLSAVRITAVLAGFVGVLLIVRPGSDGFDPWLLAGVAAAAIIVVREMITRRIPHDIDGGAVAFTTAVAITTTGLTLSVFQGWEQPPTERVGALALAACFLAVGYVSSVNAVRIGEMSFTALFRYSILVFAIVMQIIVFRDVPDGWTFAGAAVITAAGLLAGLFERRRVTERPRVASRTLRDVRAR
jgi:drug/metabolite transporter (DMT)-like permease